MRILWHLLRYSVLAVLLAAVSACIAGLRNPLLTEIAYASLRDALGPERAESFPLTSPPGFGLWVYGALLLAAAIFFGASPAAKATPELERESKKEAVAFSMFTAIRRALALTAGCFAGAALVSSAIRFLAMPLYWGPWLFSLAVISVYELLADKSSMQINADHGMPRDGGESEASVGKALGGPPAYRALAYVLITLLAAFLIMGLACDLNSWKFAVIGDEYAFLEFAIHLNTVPLSEMQPLIATGVYDDNPVIISLFQALFVAFFKPPNYGWRLSMVVLTLISLWPLISVFRSVARREKLPVTVGTLLASTSIFVFSEGIFLWSKIGKPHLPFVLPPILVCAAYLKAESTNGRRWHFLAGLSAGAGLFLGALGALTAAVLLALLLSFDFLAEISAGAKALWMRFRRDLWTVGGFAAGFLPFLLQPSFFESLITKNHVLDATLEERFWMAVQHFWTAASAFLVSNCRSHFHWGNSYDILTAVTVSLGLCACLRLSGKSFRLVFSVLVSAAFVCGSLSHYPDVPVTRIHMMAFPFALIAFTGLAALRARCAFLGNIIVCALVVLLPVYRSVKVSDYNPYQSANGSTVHAFKIIEETPPEQLAVLAFDSEENPWFLERIILHYYPPGRALVVRGFEKCASLAACGVPNDKPISFAYLDSPALKAHMETADHTPFVRVQSFPQFDRVILPASPTPEHEMLIKTYRYLDE